MYLFFLGVRVARMWHLHDAAVFLRGISWIRYSSSWRNKRAAKKAWEEIYDGQRAHNLAHKPYYSPIETLTFCNFTFSISVTIFFLTRRNFETIHRERSNVTRIFLDFYFALFTRYLTLSQCVKFQWKFRQTGSRIIRISLFSLCIILSIFFVYSVLSLQSIQLFKFIKLRKIKKYISCLKI